MANRQKIEPPATIGELLAASLTRSKIAGSYNSLYEIKGEGFEDYFLRVRRHTPGGLKAIREKLLGTSSLTVPDFFFCGPNVSQSLLNFDTDREDKPVIEIIRKIDGDRIEDYREDNGRAEILLGILMNHPEEIRALMEQAAFISLQPNAQSIPDIHEKNILVGKNGELSLVDVVSQESVARYNVKDHYGGSPGLYLNDVSTTLNRLAIAVQHKDPKSAEAFSAKLVEIKSEVMASVYDGSLLQRHPEWKGFQRLTQQGGTLDVNAMQFEDAKGYGIDDSLPRHNFIKARTLSAVALDDPPAKLKLMLDRLYAEAVPQRA